MIAACDDGHLLGRAEGAETFPGQDRFQGQGERRMIVTGADRLYIRSLGTYLDIR